MIFKYETHHAKQGSAHARSRKRRGGRARRQPFAVSSVERVAAEAPLRDEVVAAQRRARRLRGEPPPLEHNAEEDKRPDRDDQRERDALAQQPEH